MRYASQDIYTYTGPTLLALNPWRNVASLYSESTKALYRPLRPAAISEAPPGGPISPSGSASADKVWEGRAPHVYDVAKRAFERLWETGESQAILVSGESGAGKTETTKCLMKMLAESSSGGCGGQLSHTERLVLQVPSSRRR